MIGSCGQRMPKEREEGLTFGFILIPSSSPGRATSGGNSFWGDLCRSERDAGSLRPKAAVRLLGSCSCQLLGLKSTPTEGPVRCHSPEGSLPSICAQRAAVAGLSIGTKGKGVKKSGGLDRKRDRRERNTEVKGQFHVFLTLGGKDDPMVCSVKGYRAQTNCLLHGNSHPAPLELGSLNPPCGLQSSMHVAGTAFY